MVDAREAGVADAALREANAPEGTRPEASVSDAANAGPWLHTAGNHLYLGTNVFHGRGANYHDTRGCNACAYSSPDVTEVNRRADELVDNWKANFVRLDLESAGTSDNRVQWQGVLDDPTYQADVLKMVTHVTAKGAYVLLSLWDDPTVTANELPTAATNAVWRKLADMFKNEPRVLFGITNEPHNDTDVAVWASMNTAVAAIREVETQAGTPKHIIAVQGTQQWARVLDYYVTHPITAGGGENIVYETHVYDPASEFSALFEAPSQTLPVIIGEFGEQDADALMQRAEAAQVSYLAWTFHGRCPPNLIVDNSGGGCGVGMALVPTAFGQKLKNRLASPW
jgi:endoglucanase